MVCHPPRRPYDIPSTVTGSANAQISKTDTVWDAEGKTDDRTRNDPGRTVHEHQPAQRRPGAMRQGTLLPRVRAHCPIGNHLSFSNQMSKKLSPFSKKA